MKWAQSKKKAFTFLAVTALVISGTYNSVMVNSDSFMNEQDIRFVKRLDEVYGVVKVGRQFASTKPKWVKLSNKQVTEVAKTLVPAPAPKIQVAQASAAPSAPAQIETAAAVQEELDLRLVEVANPKKYQGNVPASLFSGNLVTADGRIETLSVSLPNGEGGWKRF
jgi:type IV secretory pathway VirJ component